MNLTKPFIERHWAAAAAVALLLGPFLAMLYLGRGRAAIVYLAIDIATGFAIAGILGDPATGWWANIAVRLIGAFHAVAVARAGARSELWFAHWYVVAGLWILLAAATHGALAFRAAWAEPFVMRTDALEPTIMRGDRVFVLKRMLEPDPLRQGAIVAYRSDGLTYLRRVRGLKGENVVVVETGGGSDRTVEVPADAVIGRAAVLWWSGQRAAPQWVRLD